MISIIIPTYNEEKYLGASLLKLKSLTLPHEVIITDDKSTDATATIARGYANKVLVPEKKHASIGQNRNEGVRASSGDFLVFMDADSSMKNPDLFFHQAMARFEKDPDLLGLNSEVWVVPETETMMDKIVYILFNWTHRFRNNVLKNTAQASGKFIMMKRSAFEKLGGFREELISGEDRDIFERLSKMGKVFCDKDLKVYQSGRRAHAIGWPKLLFIWSVEAFKQATTGKTELKEWKPYR